MSAKSVCTSSMQITLHRGNFYSGRENTGNSKKKIEWDYSRGQPYVTLSLLSTANATALPATSGTRGTECYRRSVSIVSLVVGIPLGPCPRECEGTSDDMLG